MSIIKESDLELKHIMLDTCFLASLQQYCNTEYFSKFENLLKKFEATKCVPVINEFIKFEFYRGCKTPKHIKLKAGLLNYWSEMTLNVSKDILDDAIKISNIYSNKNSKINKSPIDCYISSYLKTYNSDLILLTRNHSDFPIDIHDRLGLDIIDVGKEIFTFGYYKFNLSKYEAAENDFYRVMEK